MSTAVANTAGNQFNEGTGSGNTKIGLFASATETSAVPVQSFAGSFNVWVVVLRRNWWLSRAAIDPAHAWFWTPEWQESEAEVSAEYEAGSSRLFANKDEFLADLDQ